MAPFHPTSRAAVHRMPQLVDVARLQARVAAAARDPTLDESAARHEMLQHFKASDSLVHSVAARRLSEGMGGLQVARSLARYRNATIEAILDLAGVRTEREPGPGSGFTVTAVGGYGRGALAPYSDIDLLFIVGDADDPWAKRMVEILLYTLWDLGPTIGHATRTVEQCIELSHADMTVRTSVLEARYLAGDPTLFEDLRDRYWGEVAKSVTDFVDAKLHERDLRHARDDNAQYRVEPNLKDGQGGLRDLHTLYWVAKYVYRVEHPAEFVDAGLLTTPEFQAFERAAAFLWDVRCHLHFLAGRPEERLTFDVQGDLADRLRYEDRPGLQGVEAFMKDYFTVTREVRKLTGVILAALEMQNAKGRARRPWFKEKAGTPLDDGLRFRLEADRLAVVDPALFEREPSAIIALFEVMDRHRLDIHPNTQRLLTQSLHLIDDRVRADRHANQSFLKVLSEGRDVEQSLRAMNEMGVLGAFIPDFGRIVAMMQFNMYHHYTVDDHLLRTLGQLDGILKGALVSGFALAHRVARRVRSRRALFVAMFLHDIAKGRDEDHSIAGERIARELGPRLGLDEGETDAAAWLVRHHLLLSDTAQRRDIFDPKTVADVIDVVRTRERLRMLLVLTVADIKGVGPSTWTAWKAQLLEQLYLEVEATLGGDVGPTVGRRERALDIRRQVEAGLPRHLAGMALDRLGVAYWLSFPPHTCRRHARLIAVAERRMAMDRPYVLIDAERGEGMSKVTVVVPDRPGLFADLLTAFVSVGLYPVGAKAFTLANGIALDVFELKDTEGTGLPDPHRFRALRARILARSMDDERPSAPPSQRLPEREQAFVVAPQVFIDNDASDTATVLEVEHRHRPDVLFQVAATLRDLGLSIVSAHCTRYGELAVDVFYVKDRAGLKIYGERRLATIETGLRETLNKAA